MEKVYKIRIKYVGISREDYVIAEQLESVDSGFNFRTKEGQTQFRGKVEKVSGQKVENMYWNTDPQPYDMYPLSLLAEKVLSK